MKWRESGGALAQSVHSSPLTLLSFLLFLCFHLLTISPSTSLRGCKSINKPALDSHTLPSVHVLVGVICLLYTQRSQTCIQVPYLVCGGVCKYGTFWTHRICVCCLLAIGVCDCESRVYMGFKGMTHHISRCPYSSPFLVFVFLFTSSHFHLLLILFLGPLSVLKKSCLQEQELLNFLVLSHRSTVENAWLAVSANTLGGGAYLYFWRNRPYPEISWILSSAWQWNEEKLTLLFWFYLRRLLIFWVLQCDNVASMHNYIVCNF